MGHRRSAPAKLYLAGGDLYSPQWTDAIHAEWTRNLLADRPNVTPEQAKRIRHFMDAHVPDGLVAGYEGLVPTLDLPDPDDRHVLAAAVPAGASAVVTFNLADFPADNLTPHGIEAVHPDEFAFRMPAEKLDEVSAAVARHRASLRKLRKPPKSTDEFQAMIEAGGLPRTAAALRVLGSALCRFRWRALPTVRSRSVPRFTTSLRPTGRKVDDVGKLKRKLLVAEVVVGE